MQRIGEAMLCLWAELEATHGDQLIYPFLARVFAGHFRFRLNSFKIAI